MNLNKSFGTKLLLAFVLLCIFFNPAFAQLARHGNIWHFGASSGLDFSSGSPQELSNITVDTYEGCASYCDAAGNLLFYTNGGGFVDNFINGPREGIIWNAQQGVIYSMGNDKGGGYSSAQGSLFLPDPGGNANRFYLFTIDHNPSLFNPPFGTHRGLSYFIIDRSLNGGLGGVTLADQRIFSPATEAITAIPHTNGKDFWIICKAYDSGEFVVTPLTAAGVGTPFFQARMDTPTETVVIKAAPNGRFLFDGDNLYRFDAATGTITHETALNVSNYSHTFSPSGRYLFALNDDSGFADLLRFDLSQSNPALQPLVVDGAALSFNGLMQIGPDGNIYLNEQNEENILTFTAGIAQIKCPDGLAPTIKRNLYNLPVDLNNAGGLFTSLPNFADYIFAPQNNGKSDTTRLLLCDTLNGILLQSAQTGIQYRWDNGATTDTLRVHQAGVYTLEITDSCDVFYARFEVRTDNASLELSADITDSCDLFPLTLRALSTGTGTLSWLNGSSSSADSLKVEKEGIYIAEFRSACQTLRDSFEVKLSEKCCKFPDQVPNAFTPNGDNINDRFSPVLGACDLEVLELRIYARWGELVFQGFNNTETWDGLTLNGTDAVGDVYAYTLEYRLPNEQQVRQLKGEVTLIR